MRWFKIILLSTAIPILAFLLYFPYSPAGRQRANMEIARRHIPELEPLLRKESRFRHVQAVPYTWGDGCLGILGYVKSDQDIIDLKQLVNSTSPPVEVHYMVQVYASPLYEEVEKSDATP